MLNYILFVANTPIKMSVFNSFAANVAIPTSPNGDIGDCLGLPPHPVESLFVYRPSVVVEVYFNIDSSFFGYL